MGALLVAKLFVPMLLVVVGYQLMFPLRRRLRALLLVLLLWNTAVARFFFLVRDEGAWKEIGNSLSHFIIASLFCISVPLLHTIAALVGVGEHAHAS